MPLNAHEIAQQRHLKRHLTFWRFMAVIILVIGLIAISAVSVDQQNFLFKQQHIATIKISGVINDEVRLLKQLKKIEESDNASGLIVIINSPGGTVTGSEDIYLAIRKIAVKKPVAAFMRGVAASGGYIAAIAADQIFASSNTVTGSIGVIYQWPEYVELMNKVGVKMQTIKSAPLKAVPDPTSVLSDAGRKQVELMVKDSFDWFVSLVEQRRPFGKADALRLADGRVYSGRQALSEQLIDAIGDINDAQDWITTALKTSDKDAKKLDLIDWTPAPPTNNSLSQFIKIKINQLIGAQVFSLNSPQTLTSTGLMAILQH